MKPQTQLGNQLKVLILLHKSGQNAILEGPAMPRLTYIALLRVLMGMLNHHSFKSPFSPVFAILRVKAFVSKINISAVVASTIKFVCGLIGIGSMLTHQRSRVRVPPRVTILKFSLSFFVKFNFIKTVFLVHSTHLYSLHTAYQLYECNQSKK